MSTPNQSEFQDDLNAVFEKIQEIAAKSPGDDYIYRGEPLYFEKVSSGLWRVCREQFETEEVDIEDFQNQMLAVSGKYTHVKDTFELLTRMQHFGGQTNLIDFTTDYHIALFFVCDSFRGESGRVIVLQRTEEIEARYRIKKPQNPQNRVIAQKSIFVQPPKGFVEMEHYLEIDIPDTLKEPVLDHLRNHHGISTETIYNDLHGFIRNQSFHQRAYMENYMGLKRPSKNNPLLNQ